jgi:hypothetical protein
LTLVGAQDKIGPNQLVFPVATLLNWWRGE